MHRPGRWAPGAGSRRRPEAVGKPCQLRGRAPRDLQATAAVLPRSPFSGANFAYGFLRGNDLRCGRAWLPFCVRLEGALSTSHRAGAALSSPFLPDHLHVPGCH